MFICLLHISACISNKYLKFSKSPSELPIPPSSIYLYSSLLQLSTQQIHLSIYCSGQSLEPSLTPPSQLPLIIIYPQVLLAPSSEYIQNLICAYYVCLCHSFPRIVSWLISCCHFFLLLWSVLYRIARGILSKWKSGDVTPLLRTLPGFTFSGLQSLCLTPESLDASTKPPAVLWCLCLPSKLFSQEGHSLLPHLLQFYAQIPLFK